MRNNNPKHLIYGFLPIALFIFCVLFSDAQAQSAGERAVIGAEDIKPLQIGDTIPTEIWKLVFPTITEGRDNVIQFSLAEIKGRPIIIDFWSTWCGACIEGLQKIQQYSRDEKLLVLGVTNQNALVIQNFLNSNNLVRGTGLKTIVADTILKTYFPHVGIPHLVWIDSKGSIVGITGSKEIKKEDIVAFAESGIVNIGLKSELAKNHRFTLWDIYSVGNSSEEIGYHMLTPYIKDLSPLELVQEDNYQTVSYRNRPIIELYRTAFSDKYTFPSNQIEWKVPDPQRYAFWLSGTDDYQKWLVNNAVCYEKKWQSSQPINMLADLNASLGLNVVVQDSLVACLVISAGNQLVVGQDNLKGGRGRSLKNLISEMRSVLPQIHLLDETSCAVSLDRLPEPRNLDTKEKLISYLKANQLVIQQEHRTLHFLLIK